MRLSQITTRKFTESYPGNGRTVSTPKGPVEILEIHKTIPYEKITIILENGLSLDCATNHVIIASDGTEIYAEDSKDVLVKTIYGDSRVKYVVHHGIKEQMYDISIDSSDELYYSNGILSHNSGKSISIGMYLTYLYNFSKDINIGIVANRGAMAREFLNNVKNMVLELPMWLQLGTEVWNKGSIENEAGVRILTDVPSSDAFRGYSIACLVVDECIGYDERITIQNDITGEIKEISIGKFYEILDTDLEISGTHKFTDRYSVLTENGFKKFRGIKKTSHDKYLEIDFNDQTFKCSTNHLLKMGDDFISAHNLEKGDKIKDKTVHDIRTIEESVELFDLLDVQDGNHYLTSGITSHNCAFIRSSVWDEFSDSIFPSQSGLAWKKNIIVSTANGMNHFYQMVKNARESKEESNALVKLYEVNWRDVPRYKSDGSVYDPEEFMNSIIQKYGVVYFNQNYSNEFMGSSYTLVSSDSLSKMKEKDPEFIQDGKLRIFEFPKKDHKYILAVDPAKDGIDAFAVQVVDITTFPFVQVGTADLQIDYLRMPEFLNEWGLMFNTALIIVENNEGAGQSIADQLKIDYDYPNLYYDKESRGSRSSRSKRYPGFRTTTRTRSQILKTLKLFIENGNLIVQDNKTISEFLTFIHTNNKYQADDGAKDDLVMSLAIVFAPFTDVKNFDDLGALVRTMYSEEADSEFAEYLTIGNFDDFTDDSVQGSEDSYGINPFGSNDFIENPFVV